MKSWWVVPLVLGALSCSSTPRPVAVTGTPVELQSLTGEWSGEYHADGGGRQGTVVFKLAAGADSATGDVLMFPRAQPSAEAWRERARATNASDCNASPASSAVDTS